ncbi:MAG: ASKHA domain-containing protein, partial [candidate division NC10 bacterium]|nr:ASKHA domain-containing protein [candidate division NC10 bacterium]
MIKVSFPELNLSFPAEPGINLLNLAQRHSIPLDSYCGGRGTCGKCLVRVEGQTSPLTPAEEKFLSSSSIEATERLACQVQLWGDAEVRFLYAASGKREKAERELLGPVAALDPEIYKLCLSRPDHLRTPSSSTWGILRQVLRERNVRDPRVDLPALQQLSDPIWSWDLWTLILAGSRLMGIESGETTDQLYGMAFDIGTTTVVGYLLDLLTGERVGLSSLLNPQAAFGADVISRISLASTHVSGRQLLQERILSALNSLIEEAASSAQIPPTRIYALSFVGNPTMHHLLLGLDPSGLGHLPYNPVLADPIEVCAQELGIRVHPQAPLFFLPNISGYVGSDIVGGILFTGLPYREGIALGIDIGTNGEMALGSRQGILVSSTAAGPAFEGSQIRCGMRAEPGAISQVFIEEEDLRWKVVGEV